ncbi:MAG: restriction endonuclease [Alphaproteobacteria bacterium]|nr:restriction endonuclease [Alphaproteobacteria bacterium]
MTDEYTLLMSPLLQTADFEGSEDSLQPIEAPQSSDESYHDLVIEAHRQMMRQLCSQLLGFVHVQSHTFFETMVIDVLLALGYGGRRRDLTRRLGRSGDGGVDGVIEMDELGLDMIYIQAKRLKPGSAVSVSAVRDFVGSLDAQHALKGIFVTTGQFSAAAHAVVRAVSKKIVLIDGRRLAELMVRHNIGIVASTTFQFKSIDKSYFKKSVLPLSNKSALNQPIV